jgi:uncharacterized LabA/DUF88 family protein
MNTLYLDDNLPILQKLPQPIGVFIDAGNVFFTQKNMKWKIDWLKFKGLFPKKTKFSYFTAFDPKNPAQTKHNYFLSKKSFYLFTKPLHLVAGNHKGNMDVELTWEMCKSIPYLETFVLISGDGDFEYVLSDLKNNFKKNVLVVGSQNNSNYKLMQNFGFLSLENLRSKIELK